MSAPSVASPLTVFVIFDHPVDYPEHCVVRPQVIGGDGVKLWPYCGIGTLEELREPFIDAGLHQVPRQENDDPAILEVWL